MEAVRRSLLVSCLLVGACADDDGAPEIPANDYCAPVAKWPAGAQDAELEVVRLVNEHRSQGATCGNMTFGPAGPLEAEGHLTCAARVHSRDMADRNFFDHVNPDGEDPFDRIARTGYGPYRTAGENIALGTDTPEQVVELWMGSPGHCSNIMNPDYVHIGVGYVGDGNLWTQVFAAPREDAGP